MSDKRKALGDGIPDPVLPAHEAMPMVEPEDYRRNRLPGSHPGDQYEVSKPDISYTGKPNPAICSNRPIADMTPEREEASLKEGLAFRVPIGKPQYDDPDYN